MSLWNDDSWLASIVAFVWTSWPFFPFMTYILRLVFVITATASGLGSARRGSSTAQPAAPVRDEQAMREREQLAKELATLKAQKEKLLVESKKLVSFIWRSSKDAWRPRERLMVD